MGLRDLEKGLKDGTEFRTPKVVHLGWGGFGEPF